MKKYLQATDIIDYNHSAIQTLAKQLSSNCSDDVQIAKNCFEYVRDEIRHSGDYKDDITTSTASQVLLHKTGWCYAKAFLLAALLRANGIPTGSKLLEKYVTSSRKYTSIRYHKQGT